MKDTLNVLDYVVVKTHIPGCGAQITNAQIVARDGDKLSVVAMGSKDVREVSAANVESYKSVYGTSVPTPGARPLVKQY